MKKDESKNFRNLWKKRQLLRIMKLTLILLIACFVQVSATVYSQNTKFTFKVNDKKVVDVLRSIEDQSEFRFFYQREQVDVERRIDLDVYDETVESVLAKLFTGQGIVFDVRNDKLILLKPVGTASWYNDLLSQVQQQGSVSGKVTDKNNQSLPGVTVVVKGTTQGATTNLNGDYILISVPDDATLVFSFVGMKSQEVAVDNRSRIDVTMEVDVIGIEEVVAIGYGTKKRADITGSISVVNIDELKTVHSFSAQTALQGMASGVNVIKSGAPGSAAKIFIRGITNFGDTDPLVIVDGIEQNLNYLSSSDIESVQVLKDAGSASIYGVRGANGVILVTTRKGKRGAPVITYNGSYGMQFPLSGNPHDLLNTEDYMKIWNQAYPGNILFANGIPDYVFNGPGGSGVAFEGDPRIDPSKYFLETPNMGRNYAIYKVNKEGTNWYQELFNSAPSTEHDLSVSGGTDHANYLFSVGYLDQQGTVVHSYNKRYNLRVNTEFNIWNKVRIGENFNLIHRNNLPIHGSVNCYGLNPLVPVKDIMGNYAGSFGGPDLGQSGNPIAAQDRHKDDVNNYWYMIGNGYGEIDLLQDFTFRTSLGFNINNYYTHRFSPTPYETAESNNAPNQLSITSGYGNTITYTNTLNYNKTINKHNIEALLGTEAIQYQDRNLEGSKKNFFAELPNFQILDNGADGMLNSSGISKYTLFSLFTRLDYSYNSNYLLSVTLRRDGSSRFGPGKKYGIFPSGSFAWRMSEEKFMQNLNWLNDFKWRVSYGVLGSEKNVDPQNQYSLYYSGIAAHYYDLAGMSNSIMQGFGIQRIGNTYTGWEENIVTNVGFDATLFNNKFDISLEYYKKSIKGLLFTEPLPAVLGEATAPKINIGDIQNVGVDGELTYRGSIGGDFNYSVSTNITTYKNEVVDIPDPGYFDSDPVRNQVGHPVSSFFGYKVIGLFSGAEEVAEAPTQTAAAPGRFRFEDINKDSIISPDDRTFIGDPNPDFTYSINLRMEYKNFDMALFFYGSQGNEIFMSEKRGTDFIGYYPGWNKSNRLLDAWTPENTNTKIPIVESSQNFSTSSSNSSYFVEDGSYLRLTTVVLGYTINPNLLKRIYISNLRLYVQAANLFTLTKYPGVDPEVGGSASVFGVDGGRYPTNEPNLNFGISVTF